MGGLGQLYADSTYPVDVAGDACAMAFEAGATLIDMEFMQFEPVVTVWPPQCRGMEMPTAMLGDGAQLRNASGERFMLRYNPPHAERHIEKARMALCIQREIDEGRGLPEGGVWFDATPLEPHQRKLRLALCAAAGGRRGPGEPAGAGGARAHSAMGGVSIDDNGWTGVPGLYAAGEAAGGVHGASRIAGNGCSDTLVFGAVAGRHAADAAMARNAARELAPGDEPAGAALDPLRRWHGPTASDPAPLKKRIREVLAEHAGIWRSAEGLRRGQAGLREIGARLEELRAADLPGALALLETERMARCAAMVLAAALDRAEPGGAPAHGLSGRRFALADASFVSPGRGKPPAGNADSLRSYFFGWRQRGFDPTDEQRMALDGWRRFVEHEIAPAVLPFRDRAFSPEVAHGLLAAMAPYGVGSGWVPEDGGGAGYDFLTSGLLFEALARVSPDAAGLAWVAEGAALKLYANGSPALRERYLPGMLRGDVIGCSAISEPGIGSSVREMRKATRDGGYFRSSGEKMWTSNASVADVAIVVARTGEQEFSMFLVDRVEHGFETREIEKLGLNGWSMGQMLFDDVVVPAENLLGGLGAGLRETMKGFDRSRCFVSTPGAGDRAGVLDDAIAYAGAAPAVRQADSGASTGAGAAGGHGERTGGVAPARLSRLGDDVARQAL